MALGMRRNRFHFASAELCLIISPAHFRFAVGNGNHGNAIVDGTNQRTKIAADTFLFLDFWNWLARNASRSMPMSVPIHPCDALVSPGSASNIAKIAADT